MKILHVGNICSTPIIVDALRDLGHDVKVLVTQDDYFDNGSDIRCIYRGHSKLGILLRMKNVARVASDFDIVHWHSGVAWNRMDFLLIKLLYKVPVVVNYHGDESRLGYGMHYQRLINKKVVSTPDLLRWHHTAEFVPNVVKVRKPSFPEGDIVIVHMPTVWERKGTDVLIQAVDKIKKQGYEVRLDLVENVKHIDALKRIDDCHILVGGVDRSLMDIGMGLSELEGWSMGKAVVCAWDDYLNVFYPECPVVSTDCTFDDLVMKIKGLLDDKDRIRQIGLEGYRYVIQNHNPDDVAERFEKIYKEVLS